MNAWSRIVLAIAVAAVAGLVAAKPAGARSYRRPPTGQNQWYWEIGPPAPGLAGLPAISAPYPKAGSATIWDTDLFQDSNRAGAGIPTGRSPVVAALHRSGKYSICYVEVGAYQTGFPDDANFAPADYGHAAHRYRMQGYPNEWWFNIAGFRDYVAGRSSTLSGAAVDIAAALDRRFGWCKREGQDAVEPDDLDGYTNRSDTGVPGGGWHLTQADSAGFERWLAYDAHAHGLAVFQKNDPANAKPNVRRFDGMIIEECNYYRDPCSGSGGDATPYLRAGKPVLNAEYTQDGETTARFCAADIAAGITGALFDVNLGRSTYRPCAPRVVPDADLDLLVLGDCNPDLILRGAAVEPAFGQAERLVDSADLTIGGSGAITACGAARLGLRTAIAGVLGNDEFGRFMARELHERGVETSGLVVDSGARTGLSVILSREQDRAILTFPGAIAALEPRTVDPGLLVRARHVHISSFFLQTALAPGLGPMLGDVRRRGGTTSVDPNWDPSECWDGGLRELLEDVDVLLPNAVEAVRIAGGGDPFGAAQRLAALGPLVAVKLGADGALAARAGADPVRVRAPVVATALDAVGAGDSFDAGVLAALLDGQPVERALALGCVCGALSTRAVGGTAAQPTLAEALEALREVEGTA